MIKEFDASIQRSPEFLQENFIHLIVNRNGIRQQVSFLSSSEIDYVINLLGTAKAMLEKVENKNGNA